MKTSCEILLSIFLTNSCGTVQLFFDFLLHLIIFIFARFSSCFWTWLLSSNLVFLPKTFSNFFAMFIFTFVQNVELPTICRYFVACALLAERSSFSFSLIPSCTLFFVHARSFIVSAEISAWLMISAQLRPALHRSALAQQRSAVQCRVLRCVVRHCVMLCGPVLCRGVPWCAVLSALLYLLFGACATL